MQLPKPAHAKSPDAESAQGESSRDRENGTETVSDMCSTDTKRRRLQRGMCSQMRGLCGVLSFKPEVFPTLHRTPLRTCVFVLTLHPSTLITECVVIPLYNLTCLQAALSVACVRKGTHRAAAVAFGYVKF